MPKRPYNHERIHDSQAIEDCRTRRNSTFRSCVEALPEMGEILSGCGEVGWKAFGERCCQYLMASLGAASGVSQKELNIISLADRRTDFIGGDEHYISLPNSESEGRVFKWTYGDNFGLCLMVYEIDPDGMNRHVISTGNPDPRYYLNRWIILNSIAPPITRFEGLLPPDFRKGEKLPRLAISQRMLPPENPSHRHIVKGFRDIGFIEVSEHAYYRIEDNILLGDAAPRNVRFESGTIIPFDAVAEHPHGAARDWCVEKAKCGA
jgi:hypothetical protein